MGVGGWHWILYYIIFLECSMSDIYLEALAAYNRYADSLPDELKNAFYTNKQIGLHRKFTLIKIGLHNKLLVNKYERMMDAYISKDILSNLLANLIKKPRLHPGINRHYLRTLVESERYKTIPTEEEIKTMIKAENSPANESAIPSPEVVRRTAKKAKLEMNRGKLMKNINKARKSRTVSYTTLLNLTGRSMKIGKQSRRVSVNPNNNIRRIPGRHEAARRHENTSGLLDKIKSWLNI